MNQHVISLHIVPRASRDEVVGRHGESVKVRLRAPPVDGKANRALLDFLKKKLDLPAGQLELVGGATAREKRVLVRGLSRLETERRLGLPFLKNHK